MAGNRLAVRAVTAESSRRRGSSGTPTTVAVGRFGLTAATPAVRTDHVLSVTARAASGTGTLTCALYESSTLRATFTPTLTGTLTTYTSTLTTGEATAIGTYANLEIRLSAASTGAVSVEVAEASLTLPAS